MDGMTLAKMRREEQDIIDWQKLEAKCPPNIQFCGNASFEEAQRLAARMGWAVQAPLVAI